MSLLLVCNEGNIFAVKVTNRSFQWYIIEMYQENIPDLVSSGLILPGGAHASSSEFRAVSACRKDYLVKYTNTCKWMRQTRVYRNPQGSTTSASHHAALHFHCTLPLCKYSAISVLAISWIQLAKKVVLSIIGRLRLMSDQQSEMWLQCILVPSQYTKLLSHNTRPCE